MKEKKNLIELVAKFSDEFLPAFLLDCKEFGEIRDKFLDEFDKQPFLVNKKPMDQWTSRERKKFEAMMLDFQTICKKSEDMLEICKWFVQNGKKLAKLQHGIEEFRAFMAQEDK